MKTLESLFFDELADMYDAEHRLVKALPKMAEAATHDELKAAFKAHLVETEGHIKKVEQVFQAFGKEPKSAKCEATVGLLKEADEIAEDNEGSPTINAALISAAQKVEHYEIASYGCLRTWAELLGNKNATKLLSEILAQEKAADEKLTLLAVKTCNPAAEGAPGDDDEVVGPPERKEVRKEPVSAAKSRTFAAAKTR
ncbi:MAG: hypothetical protein RIS76_1101 [Verrucomicrobiota bacterium]|jgi:ferritin-like metal-binding protein YciE